MGVEGIQQCLFPAKNSLTISYLLEFLNRGLHEVNIPKPVSNGVEKNNKCPGPWNVLSTWIISWIASGEFFHDV